MTKFYGVVALIDLTNVFRNMRPLSVLFEHLLLYYTVNISDFLAQKEFVDAISAHFVFIDRQIELVFSRFYR